MSSIGAFERPRKAIKDYLINDLRHNIVELMRDDTPLNIRLDNPERVQSEVEVVRVG
ncbi:hypothetical protein [Paenibacillus sp. UMB4589-SE434]|uniref:hypothetical protein n=1 Tax=Paenibacillus sp. UMB4589-SE434 TaxID=3046314 RepID=UPI00254B7887|nr:hypothetical protein [Paenibacillus sp. UMB4589-SE434]MDK8179762.1 hypothetical protein [Paenibacillus sp. UMB4589-SE434]